MSNLFAKADFGVFEVEELDERMELIRERIQPKFQYLGDIFTEYLNEKTNHEGAFHIAQHRRRTKNAPDSTWCAFGGNNRGYKKFPHIQVGINTEYIFIWVSIIDNPDHELKMGEALLEDPSNLEKLPKTYIVSSDHTKREVEPISDEVIGETLNRLLKVKKGEFLVGTIIKPDSDLLENDEQQERFFKEAFDHLIPVYEQLLGVYFEEE